MYVNVTWKNQKSGVLKDVDRYTIIEATEVRHVDGHNVDIVAPSGKITTFSLHDIFALYVMGESGKTIEKIFGFAPEEKDGNRVKAPETAQPQAQPNAADERLTVTLPHNVELDTA